nr:3798_t:CDS:2 [Entrophospora candida]
MFSTSSSSAITESIIETTDNSNEVKVTIIIVIVSLRLYFKLEIEDFV